MSRPRVLVVADAGEPPRPRRDAWGWALWLLLVAVAIGGPVVAYLALTRANARWQRAHHCVRIGTQQGTAHNPVYRCDGDAP